MSTLIHVKAALKSNDYQRANQLIKIVLRNDPCEEAWYIAARLTRNLSQKIKYTKHALAINPEFKPAQKLMQDLKNHQPRMGVRIAKWASNSSLGQYLKQQYDQLTYTQHLMLVGSSAFILTACLGFMLFNFFAPKPIYLPDVQAFSYIQVQDTAVVLDHFKHNHLDVTWIELQPIPSGIHAGQYIEVNLQDINNTHHIVQILVYKHYSELANDVDFIELFSAGKSLTVNKNTVMIYDALSSPEIENQLIQAYLSMPTIDIHPRHLSLGSSPNT